MKTLQLALFVIANIVFITQALRNGHQLAFQNEGSAIDQFRPEQKAARDEKSFDKLVETYGKADREIRALEKDLDHEAALDVRQKNSRLYEQRDAILSEIREREQKRREVRDLWLFSVAGVLLILFGGWTYYRGIAWPGFSVLLAGFAILEYWCSPTFFGGGAYDESFQVLLSKSVLTLFGLALLYAFWALRSGPNKPSEPAATNSPPSADAPAPSADL